MREFKFRAWTESQQKFLSHTKLGDHYLFLEYEGDKPDVKLNILHFILKYQNDDRQKEFVLQQWTGLKDKNDKEVYEGDIIKLEGSPYIYSIVWNSYQWCISDDTEQLPYDDNLQPFNSVVQERAMVVGNIFENPELCLQV